MDDIKELVSHTPISPSTVAKMFQLDYPKFPLIVRGEVTGLRPYRKKPTDDPICYYGEISDTEFTIEFKVLPSDELTATGQHIEIVGSIKTKLDKSKKMIVPMLDGQVVGSIEPPKRANFVLDDNVDMNVKVSLKSFLKQNGKTSLAFLATHNGFNDFIQGCDDPHKIDNLYRHNCSFARKESIIDALQQVKNNPAIKGIVILRGGKTSNDDLRLWNDIEILQELYRLNMPFYTAIGHASDVLLSDKHAHESFTTPTMFGIKFKEALNQLYWDKERDRKISDLEHELLRQGPVIKQQRKIMIWGASIFLAFLFVEIKFSLFNQFILFLSNS